MKLCPRKQFTTLDTHDGIGVVDVRYLMPDEEVLETKKKVFEANPEINRLNGKVNFSKFDTYQICCSYYDALGSDDNRYLIARAIQFFAPGIPQVYYVGLFAGRNDFDLYEKTKQSRDINRHLLFPGGDRRRVQAPCGAENEPADEAEKFPSCIQRRFRADGYG